MNRKGVVLMFGISLTLALGAAGLANNWLHKRAGNDNPTNTASVVVAALEIPFGRKVQAADLRMIDLPPHAVPHGSFADMESVVGRVSSQLIYPGEVILQGRVSEHMGGSALAAVLDPGMRAISVRVDDVVGVAGFLLPGNIVDIVSTRSARNGEKAKAQTILEKIKVLAVDQMASQDRDGPVIVRAVTLAVSPAQAERLVEATQEGRVQLTLRNPFEKEEVVAEVAAPVAPAPAPKPVYRAPAPSRIDVIRGTQMSATTVHN